MIGVFENVSFYIIPATARRLQANNDKMISLLRTGAASSKSYLDDDVTHVICDNTDYSIAKKSVNDSAFCCFVTPKWVFISQSLHYCLPVRNYSADPYRIFSGLVFYFHNCSVPVNQVYLPLCIHYGSQVLTSIMSQCTHIIVFNGTDSKDLPSEISAFPQIRVVSDSWINETPFLLTPVSNQPDQLSYPITNTNYVYEWESDIRASVDRLFEGCLVNYSKIFKNQYFLFLPSLDHQETFFLSCSVEKMGGTVLPYLSTFEETISSSVPPRCIQGPVTHIICPYLTHGQQVRLQRLLGSHSVSILSTNWLYSCIDQYTYINQNTSNIWNSILFTPAIDSCIPSFRDCVISVTGFTSESVPTREQVKCAIDMVGACYMGPLCKDYTTHLVCLNTESDKYRATTTWKTGIFVVRADWLLESIKKWERMNEKDYLLREEKEEVNEDDIPTGDEDEEDKKEVNEDDISTGDEEEEEVSLEEKEKIPVEKEVVNDVIPSNEAISNEVTQMEEEERVSLINEEVQNEVTQMEEEERVSPVNEEVLNETRTMEEEESNEVTPIPKENETSQQISQLPPETEHTPNHSHSPALEPQIKPHVFLLSSDQSATNHVLTISSLGGEFIQTNHVFDPTATHLILSSPKRTEKYLGAVACGLWVLKPEYLEDCAKEGKWLDEEPYEWSETSEKSRIVGSSISRWRKRGGGAFNDTKVVLVGELIPTSEQWSRIITAGGGRTVSVKNSITNGLRQFVKEEKEQTRLAVVPDKAKKTKVIQFLLDHHYICVSSGYLLDYLSKDPLPSMSDYIIFQ